VNVPCPYCKHVLNLKSVKAGRFTPKCPKCTRTFALTVSADDPPKLTVKPLAPAAKGPAPAAAPPKPAAAPQGATGEWQPPSTAPADTGGATGEWQQPSAPPATTPGGATGEFQPPAAVPPTAAGQATGEYQSATPAPGPEAIPLHEPSAGSAVPTGATDVAAASSAPAKGTKVARKTRGDGRSDTLPPDAPASLGGYQLLKELGQGGMGTVYLARQVSLDRKVALKTMKRQWAENPRFLARFTREAYAAAQLIHHNVVQIYDIGEQGGVPYFSMEFVSGTDLAHLVQERGKLDVEEAVGYVLQAARGLKFAHDQGMVHRDIKPDNLMLNDLGVVKVADLGLVKTPGAVAAEDAAEEGAPAPQSAEITAAGVAMGTPAYMAPEQGSDAAHVDHRADIYSLGCTLYVLVTGRPPFQGKTAMEVISKHQCEPIVRPERIVERVPRDVSDILLKMLAKKPTERYADLGEVIRALEEFLGVTSTGPFTPQEEHARTLEKAAADFNAAPAIRLRTATAPIFLGIMGLVFLVMLFSGQALIASYVLGLTVFTTLFTFVVSGLHTRSHLFLKTRELVFDNSWTDWLTWVVGILLVVGLLIVLGKVWVWGLILLVSAGLAAVYNVAIDRKLEADRKEPLEKAEELLKVMRLRGLEEEALRQFVCKYSGNRWEEFYETLFGYEALLGARKLWGETGGRRAQHYAAWRDPVVRWVEGRQKARRAARERKLLEKLERKRLEATGVSAAEAKEKAREAAEDLVDQAAALKQEATTFRPAGQQESAASRRQRIAAMLARSSGSRRQKPRVSPVTLLFQTALGPKVRFLAGAVLLGLCLIWAQTNKLLDPEKAAQVVAQVKQGLESQDVASAVSEQSAANQMLKLLREAKPLPILPGALFNSFAPGVAGLLLILAALASNVRTIALCMAGAVVAFFGPLVPLHDLPFAMDLWLWPAAGVAVALLALVLRLLGR
jgi:hypothetical protein